MKWVVVCVVLVLIVVAVFVFYPYGVEGEDVEAGSLGVSGPNVVGDGVAFRYYSALEDSRLEVYSEVPLDDKSVIEFGRKTLVFFGKDFSDYEDVESRKRGGMWFFSFGDSDKEFEDGGRIIINETARTYVVMFG